jgi:hypothetical protein
MNNHPTSFTSKIFLIFMACALMSMNAMAMNRTQRRRDAYEATETEEKRQKRNCCIFLSTCVAASLATVTLCSYFTPCKQCPCLPEGTMPNPTTPVCIHKISNVHQYDPETMEFPQEHRFGRRCCLISDYKRKPWWPW